jgi:hypothetical protein
MSLLYKALLARALLARLVHRLGWLACHVRGLRSGQELWCGSDEVQCGALYCGTAQHRAGQHGAMQ